MPTRIVDLFAKVPNQTLVSLLAVATLVMVGLSLAWEIIL